MSVRQYRNSKNLRPPKNRFNLSHSRLFTADPFKLYPCLVEDCLPGDRWKIGSEVLIRNNPMAAPIMHEQNCYIHYYFVPYRLLWDKWEDYYRRGREGKYTVDLPRVNEVIRGGRPETGSNPNVDFAFPRSFPEVWENGGILDYLGFNRLKGTPNDDGNYVQYTEEPLAFPLQAYLKIWDEYYRDTNYVKPLITGADETPASWDTQNLTSISFRQLYGDFGTLCDRGGIMKRAWGKDYFTSALPWLERGQPVGFGISGNIAGGYSLNPGINFTFLNPGSMPYELLASNGPNDVGFTTTAPDQSSAANQWRTFFGNLYNLQLDTSDVTVDISIHDLRFAFQVTKFFERSARNGSRYIDEIRSHFGVSPNDSRLQRPEYIGGVKIPMVVNEVLQTNDDGTKKGVGDMYGHGITVDRNYNARYFVQEPGIIMGLMSFLPNAMYQDGVERMWLKKSYFDNYFPEFMNLSEQAIKESELMNMSYSKPSPNYVVKKLGFIGRWDEYRFRRNTVHGLFKSDFQYWHMGRTFVNPETGLSPTGTIDINMRFLYPYEQDIQGTVKRVLQVPSEPMYLVHLGNLLDVVRPLPYVSEPGFADHL